MILTPSRIPIELMMRNTILALDDLCYHQPLIAFCSTQTCSCFVLYLEFLVTQHCSSLPWIIIIFYIKDAVRNAPPLKNSFNSITSRHLRSFLGPRVVSNRNTGYRTLRVNSKLLAALLL